MEDNKKKSSSVVLSQSVSSVAKKTLDEVTNKLEQIAIEKGYKQPKKGDVLSKLIELGAKRLDLNTYFN